MLRGGRPSDPEHPDVASADETSADDARRRLREQGIVAVRHGVSIERRKDTRDPAEGLLGDLYVTTSRLVHLGSVPVEIKLLDIMEAVAATGALRLVVGDGRGVEIRTSDPCLLRVEIAAVREAARMTAAGSGDTQEAGEGTGQADTAGR